MSVLEREALDDSPLADLHTIASELSIDGYRRLRRADLIDAILKRQGGVVSADADEDETSDGDATPADTEVQAAPRRRRGRRGGRGRDADSDGSEGSGAAERGGKDEGEDAPAESRERSTASRDAGRERRPRADRSGAAGTTAEKDQTVEGVVELLANGSGFIRLSAPEPSDDDVYISAAQVKRCELVAGDRVSGPRRAPRRSERFPSLIRIDAINGRPADQAAEGTRYDDLPAAFPDAAIELDADDATLAAIARLAPIGHGSRVTIVGPARSGKSEILRALAAALSGREGLEVSLVLAGVRPEEISEWSKGSIQPATAASFAVSADAQAQAVERVVEQARRVVARGANAVVLIDTLEGVHPPAARKALAAARNIVDGGSLTVIATAARAFGGETTVIALDARMAATGSFPALDPLASGTLRPELLVGDQAAEAISQARSAAAAS